MYGGFANGFPSCKVVRILKPASVQSAAIALKTPQVLGGEAMSGGKDASIPVRTDTMSASCAESSTQARYRSSSV